MVRPARTRRSTAKSTFRPSSRIYFRPRHNFSLGTGPDRSASAGAASIGLSAQTPKIKIDVQSGGGVATLPAALAAYSFTGATSTVTDDSGNGHDFTLTGGAVRSGSGHTGSGIANSGSGTTATLANPAFGQTGTRTVMLWMINPENNIRWVLRWNVVSIDSGAWGILNLGSTVSVQARNAGGFVRAGVTRPTDGLWHHYAATYDGTDLRFYLDGVLADTQAITAPLRTDADTIDIAEWVDTSTVVDDVRIFDSALDASTITSFMGTPVGSEPVSDPPHLAKFGMAAQNASVSIKVNAGVANFDLSARAPVPVQNIACAWFETAVTVDQHFCTIDPDAYETAIILDAHEGVVGVDAHYGDVVICGRP